MNVLSLYDGMACGMIAFIEAGIPVNTYTAYEIDKYAIKTATHNFPNIKECGDIFEADFAKYKDIDYVIGGSPCFTEGHLVLTDKGYKDISKIEIGDNVLTHKNRFMPVVGTYKRESPTVNLKITGYPNFITTDNHPFYCETRSKPSYSEYIKQHTWRHFSEPQWIKVQDMNENTFCGIHANANKIADCNIDNETLWLLGRYVADGHIRKSKRKERKNSYQYQFIISVGDHKLEYFKSMCKSRHYSCCPHQQSVHRCVFSSKELVDFVIDNNFGTNALTKRIPEFIMNLPDEKAEIFLNGYLSDDGHYIENDDSYNATTISKELAFDLQRLGTRLYKTNVGVSLQPNNRVSIINNRVIKGNYPIYVIKFKKGIRKQSVAHYNNDIVWTAFKNKKPTGNIETVYNIEVAEDHSYTVNNCIVHNCTYWSIAQKNNRETEASGLGWELFSQYVRAIKEVKPKFFIYENNKSMSNAIRESISETFGFEPICINSALVSAQNRQRLYWVGKLKSDDTYEKVNVQQPEDRGILLKDILDAGCDLTTNDKAWTLTAAWNTIERSQRNMAIEPVCVQEQVYGRKAQDDGTYDRRYEARQDGKSGTLTPTMRQNAVAEPVGTTKNGKAYCLTSGYSNGSGENIGNYAAHTLEKGCKSMVAEPVNLTEEGKSQCLRATCYKDGIRNLVGNNIDKKTCVAEPVCMRYERSEEAKRVRKQYECGEVHHGFRESSELHPRTDGKTNTLSTVLKDNPICEPVCVAERGRYGSNGIEQHYEARDDGKTNVLTTVQKDNNVVEPVNITTDCKSQIIKAQYQNTSIANIVKYTSTYGGTGVAEPVRVGALPRPNGELSTSQAMRVYSTVGKSVNLVSGGGGMGGKTGLYAIPLKDRKANTLTTAHVPRIINDFENYTGYAKPCEWDENGNPAKAISYADGKTYIVYEVKGGQITIKGKQYPIKLADGYYIIRKLTVSECKRLQTVPEWYEFPVSNTQAYKMLGNGWTVEVIKHILSFCK